MHDTETEAQPFQATLQELVTAERGQTEARRILRSQSLEVAFDEFRIEIRDRHEQAQRRQHLPCMPSSTPRPR